MSLFCNNRGKHIIEVEELRLGVLFLLIKEKTRSSPAFECGIVRIALTTSNRLPNSKVLVPGSLQSSNTPKTNLHDNIH